MRLATDEFIRRFLIHVLPSNLHRIRHYGLFANATRGDNLAKARELLMSQQTEDFTEGLTCDTDNPDTGKHSEGAPMRIIETFARGQLPRAPPNTSGGS